MSILNNYIPATISPEAKKTLKTIYAKNAYKRVMPAADDTTGWHKTHNDADLASKEANTKVNFLKIPSNHFKIPNMSNNDSQKIRVPMSLTFAAFVIILGGVIYAESIINPLLMALFISIICAQPITWLQKRKVPQGLSIAIVYVGILTVFIVFGEIIGNSASSFSQDAPAYEKNLDEMGNAVLQVFQDKGINISTDKVADILEPSKVMSYTAGLLSQMGSFMGNAVTIFFLALFLLLELDSIKIKAEAIVKNTNVTLSYLNVIGESIRHYLSIKTMTSLLTGLVIWILLTIMGVNYAVIWALLAFLLNYIPNIGSILAAVPAVLFALVQLGFGGAIATIVIFVAVNMVVGNVIEPKLMGKGLGLSTFIVFVALIFWGFILGTVGMFLSVPLTMAIKIILEQDPRTKWIAVVLGTDEDAKLLAEA